MFDFLFSPSGTVGRMAWWGMQVVTFLWMVIAGDLAITVIFSALHLVHTPATSTEWVDALVKAISLRSGPLIAFLLIALAGFWCNLVIEIKRWHDRGMSGWWILLRLVEILLPTRGALGIFLIPISLFQLVNLGFLGQPRIPLLNARSRSEHVVSSMRIALRVGALIGLLCILAGVALPFLVHNSKAGHVQSNPGTALPPVATSPGTVLPPIATSIPAPVPVASHPLDESAYHGTSATDFGLRWVIVDGQKVEGITSVRPAPDAQVSILDTDGGLNVPAAKLPQGFLDAWHITPQLLKSQQ